MPMTDDRGAIVRLAAQAVRYVVGEDTPAAADLIRESSQAAIREYDALAKIRGRARTVADGVCQSAARWILS
jgi:hypothetical protein